MVLRDTKIALTQADIDGAWEVYGAVLRERDEAHAEIERLRINLRDYRQKHPCSHQVMCWADEVASKALDRPKDG